MLLRVPLEVPSSVWNCVTTVKGWTIGQRAASQTVNNDPLTLFVLTTSLYP
jgi:hypothetical protein